MKNKVTFLYFIFFIFFASGCDSFVTLTIRNNTTRDLYAMFYYDSSPDTNENFYNYYMANTIGKGKCKVETLRGTYSKLSTQYVTLFVYEIDTLTKYRNTLFINTNKLYSRRITYSLSDLKKMNWQVNVE